MAGSVEDLLNQALRRFGYETPIGFIYEGSRAARVGLEIYGQTRDNQIRLLRPLFARRDAALALIKTAPAGGYGLMPWTPAAPAPPWLYEYAYPADCLDLRAVRDTPMVVPSYLPAHNLFTVANDAGLAPPAKVILCNVASAIAVYTAQVVDMTTWDPTFTEAMVAALARRLAQALVEGNAAKEEAGEEQAADSAVMQRRA